MADHRILLVEDHRLLADSLSALLSRWQPAVQVRQAHQPEELIAHQHFTPTLVVLDWHVPGIDSAGLALQMAERHPPVPVLVVTASTDVADLSAALDVGVSGYLPKSVPMQTLFSAMDALAAGGTWISADQARQAAAFRRRHAQPGLSNRQLDVLKLLARGHSNVQIGQSLAIRPGTVKSHIASILSTLGADNRADAVYRARARGLLDTMD